MPPLLPRRDQARVVQLAIRVALLASSRCQQTVPGVRRAAEAEMRRRRRGRMRAPQHVIQPAPASRGIRAARRKSLAASRFSASMRARFGLPVSVFSSGTCIPARRARNSTASRKAEVFYLHYEVYDSAALAAAEAVVYLLRQGTRKTKAFFRCGTGRARTGSGPLRLLNRTYAGHDVHYVVALHKLL